MRLRRSLIAEVIRDVLFCLIIVGYPLIALFGSVINMDSTVVSWPFRISVIILAGLLWLILPPTFIQFCRLRWLLTFWVMYSFRLLWDLYSGYFPEVEYAVYFFVATVLVPCMVLSFNPSGFDQQRTSRILMVLGGTVCVLVLLTQQFHLGQERMKENDRMYFEALNPITIGHAAVSTLIAILCAVNIRQRWFALGIYFSLAMAALTALLLSGSRGPVIALTVCSILYIANTRRWFWLTLLAFILLPELIDQNSVIGQRFGDLLYGQVDRAADERLLVQRYAIYQFFDSPFLGSSYLEHKTHNYPHNVFLESGMALGVPGLMLISYVLWLSWRNSMQHLRSGQLLLPMLFVQYLIAAQFSGALWGNSALWVCMVLLATKPDLVHHPKLT